MLPDPLHPAVVHLPLALAAVVPLCAAAALYAIRSGFLPARAWVFATGLQVLLAGSAWIAVDTGGDQYDRVKRVVAEERIGEHADAAEWFAYAATATALIFAAGLARDRIGRPARITAVLASLFVLATAVRTGYLGGQLVYHHGAARAYTEAGGPEAEAPR
ncbi:MAG TPA: DUF2231 domain-containing protein [Myxococcota bacterium]|nr:DUF2231 domain-containing protein [Myxococcota bacterium]